MTYRKPFLAEISSINIFHITQYFLVKTYKRDQWNLPNILAYISGIFNDFFKGPYKITSVSPILSVVISWLKKDLNIIFVEKDCITLK